MTPVGKGKPVFEPRGSQNQVLTLQNARRAFEEAIHAITEQGYILEIVHATAFRFEDNATGGWTNPVLVALTPDVAVQAMLQLMIGTQQMLVYGPFPGHPMNDLSIANGVLISNTLKLVFERAINLRVLSQNKKRKWGSFVEGKAKGGQALYIRVPHA